MNNFIEPWWGIFIAKYCRVSFLCYNGEANWLGMILLTIGLGLAFVVILATIAVVCGGILDLFKRLLLTWEWGGFDKNVLGNAAHSKKKNLERSALPIPLAHSPVEINKRSQRY